MRHRSLEIYFKSLLNDFVELFAPRSYSVDFRCVDPLIFRMFITQSNFWYTFQSNEIEEKYEWKNFIAIMGFFIYFSNIEKCGIPTSKRVS